MLLCFIVVFSPLARAAWDLWAVTLIHVVSLVIFLIYLVPELWNSDRIGFRFRLDSVYVPLGLFFLMAFLSYFTSVNKFNTRNELFNLANYLFLFFMAGRLLGGSAVSRGRQYFFFMVLVTGSLLSLVGFHQFLRGVSVTGTMVNSNILAGYLVMIIPISLGLALREWHTKNVRIMYLGFFGLMLACLLMTKSMGAILGVFTGCMMLLYLMNGKDFFKKHKYYLAGLVLIIAGLMIIKLGEINIANRFSWWEAAVKMIADRPILGVGPGNFGNAFLNYKSGFLNSLYAHNHFLQVGSETGLIGFIAFLWFLVKALKRRNSADNLIFCGICGALIQGFMDYNLCIPANAVLFWVMLGMIQGENSRGQDKFLSFELNREKKAIITVVVLITVMGAAVVVIKPFLASRQWVFGNLSSGQVSSHPGETEENKKALRLENLNEAEDYYKKAIAIDPLNSLHYSALADVYMNYYIYDNYSSWLDEAIIEMKKAIKYQNCHAPFHRNLSLLYQLKIDYPEAVNEIQRAIRCDRNNGEYRRILAGLVKISSVNQE